MHGWGSDQRSWDGFEPHCQQRGWPLQRPAPLLTVGLKSVPTALVAAPPVHADQLPRRTQRRITAMLNPFLITAV